MEYKKTSHIFHFILTILFFPWAIVWVLCALRNHQHNAVVDRVKRDEEFAILQQVVYNGKNVASPKAKAENHRWNE